MRVHAYTSLAALCLTTAFASCSPLGTQSDPSRFYVLNGTPEEPSAAASQKLPGVTVGVGPFTLAPYLDRVQVVSRLGPNEVALSAIDRWAEPLTEGIVVIIQENLVWYLEPQDITDHPWVSLAQPDYAIQMEMAQFERNVDGDAEIWAIWTVRPAATGRRSGVVETRIVEPVESASTAAVVSGLSRALARLTSEVSDTIRAMHARGERR